MPICVCDLLATAPAMSTSIFPYRLQTSEDLYEVVLARLDAVRRREPFDAAALRTAFTQASATLQASKQKDCGEQTAASDDSPGCNRRQLLYPDLTTQASLGDALDPALRVAAYWAACEANLAHDIEAARSVWEAILRTSAGRCESCCS